MTVINMQDPASRTYVQLTALAHALALEILTGLKTVRGQSALSRASEWIIEIDGKPTRLTGATRKRAALLDVCSKIEMLFPGWERSGSIKKALEPKPKGGKR